jgi:hypothetical protein
MIEELKDCFREDFSTWLLRSNNPKIKPYTINNKYNCTKLNKVVEESLQDILDILLREPQADYFWYNWDSNWNPEHGGKLSYSLPHHRRLYTPPANALRVDKEKIKIFLRDIKIETILQ